MTTATQHTQSGRITIVQESRFRLVADDGHSFLFVLAHGANAGADDLRRWQLAGIPVTVAYSGTPGLASCVAHAIHLR